MLLLIDLLVVPRFSVDSVFSLSPTSMANINDRSDIYADTYKVEHS
jgi:hypothetical protein